MDNEISHLLIICLGVQCFTVVKGKPLSFFCLQLVGNLDSECISQDRLSYAAEKQNQTPETTLSDV